MKLTFTLAVHVHYHLMLLDNIRIKKMKQQQQPPPHHTTKQTEKKPGRGAIWVEFGGMEKR